ncbi:MAG: DNA-processing protein DprA [Anaeromyxobacter sp.]
MDVARTIRPGDGPYPGLLAGIPDRPGELRVRGDLRGDLRRVAIVGARDTDEYGADLAHELAAGLARAGVSVVSGGARGIDGAAHKGALDAGGHTVAVLGTGVDVCYPAQHRALFARILQAGGALVSELPDGTHGSPRTFPQRNRIISGMCEAVVVVRAAGKSGALITASRARSQGRRLLAVPGDARDALSAGPHRLIRQGAALVTCAADVLAELGLGAVQAQQTLPTLSLEAGRLLGTLARRPRHVDEVASAAGMGAGAALAGLLSLELQGLCEQRPGHYFLRREGIRGCRELPRRPPLAPPPGRRRPSAPPRASAPPASRRTSAPTSSRPSWPARTWPTRPRPSRPPPGRRPARPRAAAWWWWSRRPRPRPSRSTWARATR